MLRSHTEDAWMRRLNRFTDGFPVEKAAMRLLSSSICLSKPSWAQRQQAAWPIYETKGHFVVPEKYFERGLYSFPLSKYSISWVLNFSQHSHLNNTQLSILRSRLGPHQAISLLSTMHLIPRVAFCSPGECPWRNIEYEHHSSFCRDGNGHWTKAFFNSFLGSLL